MVHNSKDLPRGTMPAKIAFAPFALSAGEIDFTDDSFADEIALIRCHHFTDKFMSRRSRETVIAPKQFEVGIADAGTQKPNKGIAGGPTRFGYADDGGTTLFNVNGDHAN